MEKKSIRNSVVLILALFLITMSANAQSLPNVPAEKLDDATIVAYLNQLPEATKSRYWFVTTGPTPMCIFATELTATMVNNGWMRVVQGKRAFDRIPVGAMTPEGANADKKCSLVWTDKVGTLSPELQKAINSKQVEIRVLWEKVEIPVLSDPKIYRFEVTKISGKNISNPNEISFYMGLTPVPNELGKALGLTTAHLNELFKRGPMPMKLLKSSSGWELNNQGQW